MIDKFDETSAGRGMNLEEFEEWLDTVGNERSIRDDLEFAFSQVRSSIGVFKESVRALAKWLPLVVRDRQWDHAYLMRMLDYKLSLMEEFLRSKDAMATTAVETANKIHEARLALAAATDEGYCWASDWYEKNHAGECDLDYNTIKFAERFQQEGLNRFTEIFRGYMLEWWD